MYGQSPPFRHGGRGRGISQPQQQQQIHLNSNFFANPNTFLQQNPNFLPHLNPFLQSPVSFHQLQQQFPNSNFPIQPNSEKNNVQTRHPNGNNNIQCPQQKVNAQSEIVEKVDKAVVRARSDLLASNENVSAWKVSQAALLMVKADSWESLGFQMQQVPSLNRLLATEGKINAFIHCFVAVRRITSVYDMEVAICESEGIEQFEELELGPLVRHPLVFHYFSVTSDVTEVYRIRTEEIIYYLCEFIDIHPKKEVKVDPFLDFISKKKSVSGREKLCVRIQNFGAYVRHIKQARQSEDRVLKKCYEKTTTKSVKMSEKRPLFSAQKKEMDDHFTAISQRMKSFSSASAQFCGTHIRFVSSSSEDDNSEGEEYENNRDKKNADHHCSLSLPNVRPECVSRCPYPSATEEMTRLGLKNVVDTSPCTLGGGVRCSADNEPCRRKRRFQHACTSSSEPCKQIKRGKSDANLKNNGPENEVISVPSFSVGSLRMFVTTWKATCQGNTADEVLERMLQFYKTKKKRKVKEMFTTYPFVGLLYSAVTCIKFGMCDNMYDACQTLSQLGMGDKPLENSADYTSVDVEPAKEDLPVPAPKIAAHDYVDVAAEDIMERISGYFEDDIMNYINPSGECRFHFLRKLCKCEYWLSELYSVNRFESLGYGEYFMFLEKYMHLLPCTLRKLIMGGTSENVSLEACLLPMQLDVLLSQTLDSLYGDEIINMQNISELLARQFPLVCFKLVTNDVMANLVDTIREKMHKLTSTSVLFSAPLLKLPSQNEKKLVESSGVGNDTVTREGIFTTEDVIEVLTKAPMLTDLSLWLHWDILFAPSLGSIVEWLLKEVNTKEFLCLITKDGKVIRVDHSATLDSFLKVFIRGSPFETAVALLSLCVLYGSERNVPLSLIKCHTRQGFEVIISNYLELGLLEDKDSHAHGKPSFDQCVVGKSTSSNLGIKLGSNKHILNKAASVTSRFILDCLSYLPIEFCSFAADVLISGLQHFLKDVPSAILNECKQIEHRLMLHEVGISLGLVEWVQDYHSFRSSATAEFSSGSSFLEVINSKFNTRSNIGEELVKYPSSLGEPLVSYEVVHNDLKDKQVNSVAAYTEISVDGRAATSEKSKIADHIDDDPAKVIESIRHEEFGLDQSLSVTENKMLEKQHARLGRALHCLSQELYSQDSHFLLELVQNADDNIYPKHVEPTLTFVLHEKGIIVLNNEQGFSANDIRALCDIGNSTKKGHNAGYIGKKGIGFKSVFRVSDAPEIHSNGFHIKFDITKGQIGFVLPTVVPPCDIELYSRWATADADRMDPNFWTTCIVLPFRSILLEGFGMNNILSMFSDLHPSVLLFLHRLQCIKVRNILDDSLMVMRKEIIGDGIVEVALGNEKMTWFVATQKLKADVISSNVQTTEISIAFTLQETGGGGYVPILNQQPVFAFLPLRTYGLKFILQGDFVLPSSREEVDGNSLWNQWLLSEFPDLFVNAERSFCGLPCYRGSLGKAITVFMSFIPLVGEVHGFFSSLPRMIISKLRMSNCLILESDEEEWVPPCKVLRNWTDQTCALLPSGLLHEHLGLGFLNKDIVLPDSLAKALGIEDYGPRILLRFISSLCRSNNGLKSMGLSWLASWLSAIYVASSHSFLQTSQGLGTELDFILNLQKTPFIPLSDGKYSSLDEGTIWMHSEVVGQCITDECLLKAFPKLYVKLRIVSPNLLAAATDTTVRESVTTMLHKVGVQQLSFHDIVKVHVLPSLSDDKSAAEQELMIEYLAFAMFHLQSSCTSCSLDKGGIMAELREKALILTNYGYKRLNEVPIHFNLEYGSLDVNKLISGLDIKWHEIDTAYLKHPITKSISGGALKWRNFFQELGVTDFVQVVQVEKSVCDMSLVNSKDVIHCKDMTSMDPVSKNWESEELSHLLSCLCSRNDGVKSKCLLEILDRLWDDCFTNKVNGYLIDCNGESKLFKSSFISILQDFPWVVSNIDNKLHYPKDLFHDCVEVKSVFGVSAPYTVPKVRSEKLLTDIGLKTQVTLDDALCILRLWRRSEAPLKASISQMSKFYAFLWKGMAHSKKKVTEELLLGPFIFIPNISSYMDDDVVPGVFLSPQEVYWHDTIGSIDQMKSSCSECNTSSPCRKMLYNYYPNLHDFFVNECGVDKSPPFCSYLQILLQLSAIALPHQVAKRVFEVFLMWDNGLKSGSLSFEDAEYLKESLMKKEFTVLPTRQDKWVSLHALFGLICWCDDDNLGREFRHLDGVDFLYFGKSNDGEDQMPEAKVSTIMQRLGIPALSEIVTREAIYYGPADCSFMLSLVNRVLPYAQRYVYYTHADKYFLLKQSGFQNLRNLKIVVVEKLFFQNVIKKCKITSKKRHECNCLLQDNILYCSRESDPHSIFLELSCLLYNGTPDLHFANFLHMITTMAESGATEEQTEFFILNSQKVPQLPAEETCWSLQSVSSSVENNASLLENGLSAKAEEQNTLFKRRPSINSNWPPVDWKTAPGFNCVSTFGLKKPGESSVHVKKENFAELSLDQIDTSPSEISNDVNIEIDPSASSQGVVLLEAEISESQSNVNVSSNLVSKVNLVLDTVDLVAHDNKITCTSNCSERDQASAQQALLTGRLGELIAFKYFVGELGEASAKWVNQTNETGLPYDIILGGDENAREYIEVKATKSARKNWFLISMREWQFAVEKGESFSIAHVVLADNNMAKVTIYKNLARLCQLGNLRLAVVVPK